MTGEMTPFERRMNDVRGMRVLPPGTPVPPKTALPRPTASADPVPPPAAATVAALEALKFKMPNPVKISGRSSSITNSFVNAIIPVIKPSLDEVAQALQILGMEDGAECSYCGDPSTEWDHLRPLIVAKAPTGYISEIHNLVPACGKCNQSKGNKDWRSWMLGTAKLSPNTRGIGDLDQRVARLAAFEAWKAPTKLDFPAVVGAAEWAQHEANRLQILALMKEADKHAASFREAIKSAYLAHGSAAGHPAG